MAPTAEEIVNWYHQRRSANQGRMTRMNEIKDAYEGKLAVPLPELDRDEKPMVANLMTQGINQSAMRISSTLPNVSAPPMRPGFDNNETNANDRRNALYGWWTQNRLNIKQRQRARWLITFASAPVMVRYDPTKRYPVWQERNPLTSLGPPGNDLCPVNFIFSFKKTLAWLRNIYPVAVAQLDLGKPQSEVSGDTEFTIIEYADHEVLVQVVLGTAPDSSPTNSYQGGQRRPGRPFVELERQVNRAGICPVVNPTTIGLDGPPGQFDGLVGLFWNQSMLMALELIAVRRSIFTDRWKIARQGESVQTIVEADGMAGVVGEMSGGTIQDMPLQPGVQTYPTMDRIERAMRLTGGIPAEMTGESPTNIRTARRGAQVMSSTVDFGIQEAQEIFEASLEEENRRAIAIDKAYFGDETKSFWFDWNGARGRGSYVPNELWVTDETMVRYAFPGADINELVVGGGQRIGMETMSHHRFMEIDPLIDDPALEQRRILTESTDRALLQGWQTQVSQGTVTPDDAAYVNLQIAKGKSLAEGIQAAQQRAQNRQASQPSPGPGAAEAGAPVPAGSPEAQAGLAAGPAGAAAPVDAPAQGQVNLQQLMGNLRRTASVPA